MRRTTGEVVDVSENLRVILVGNMHDDEHFVIGQSHDNLIAVWGIPVARYAGRNHPVGRHQEKGHVLILGDALQK
ncbi:MAG: hypothetical protein ABIP50_00565 [Candidatus Saccharimonadales bacterium]